MASDDIHEEIETLVSWNYPFKVLSGLKASSTPPGSCEKVVAVASETLLPPDGFIIARQRKRKNYRQVLHAGSIDTGSSQSLDFRMEQSNDLN
ncbi:hypothetical protein PILCRDRAFT_2010 [Piloderma croceum F 1598]|uniref:Uncharacterized protein n=1 Tax=Piloderma croceum (strain F 1598) TaxID=765440 RepID=A0A0C3CJ18_PILCF|nr:hypothetical protein PILCRDRAFT_2010 [Piloderma croceum F 1598]